MKRPKIFIHIAQTVDARISLRHGPSRKKWEDMLASEAPYATPLWGRVLRNKIRPGALLSGSETFLFPPGKPRRKVPGLTRSRERNFEDYLPAKIVRSVRRGAWSGWQIAVDSGGRISWRTREKTFWGKDWHPLVLVSERTPPFYLSHLRREGIPYLIAGTLRVDLNQAMEKVYDELGVRRLASLGGGRLNGALLRAGLVDEVSVVLVPMIVGGRNTPTSFNAVDLAFDEMPLFIKLVGSKIERDGTVWLRYFTKNQSEGINSNFK